MGLKLKLKKAVVGLSNTKKAVLVFLSSVLPPTIVWLQQVSAGMEITTASLALLGSAFLGGVLAFVVKMLDNTD